MGWVKPNPISNNEEVLCVVWFISLSCKLLVCLVGNRGSKQSG